MNRFFCLPLAALVVCLAAAPACGQEVTYPLEEDVATLDGIIVEMLAARTSERAGRLIDHDQAASMERKKVEGYF